MSRPPVKRVRRGAGHDDGGLTGAATTPGDGLRAVPFRPLSSNTAPTPPDAAGAAPVASKKRRDPLATTAHERRYLSETSTQCYLSTRRAREEPDGRIVKARFDRARMAAQVSHTGIVVEVTTRALVEYKDGAVTGRLASLRRGAVAFLFEHAFGRPSSENWGGQNGTVARIRQVLGIPLGSAALVRQVLEDAAAAVEDGIDYDPDARLHATGRHVLIEPGSREAGIIAGAMETGLGLAQSTVMVNAVRMQLNRVNGFKEEDDEENEKDPKWLAAVSYHAVQGFVDRNDAFDLHKRETKKSGKEDKGARCAV